MDVEQEMRLLRGDFPMLQQKMHGHDLVYFDSAATTLKPLSVIETLSQFYRQFYGTVHRAVYELATHATETYQATRVKVKDFLGAACESEIVYTKGTTEAINLVASSFGKAFICPGDEIILSQIEHHANIVPWQLMAEERGATLRVIPVNDLGELDLEAYASLFSSRTKMVAFNHVANSIGTINPVKEMVRMARERGVPVLLDGAQSAANLPFDVQDLGVDFYVFSGHKAFGPTGVGILYAKDDWLHRLPPYQGGGDMIQHVSFEKTLYQDPPLKFEAGTPPIAQVIGLGAALDYIQAIGKTKIHEWEQKLLARATEKLRAIPGVRIIGEAPAKGGILSFVVDGVHPLDLGTFLDLRGIAVRTGHHCAYPTMERFGLSATTRASFSIYNTLDEVDYFAEQLSAIIQKLR